MKLTPNKEQSFEVVEDGRLIFRPIEPDGKKNYSECVVWLAKYNRANPGNRARIQVSSVRQMGLFSEEL